MSASLDLSPSDSGPSSIESAAISRRSDDGARVTLGRVVRSEWIKFWSVRSIIVGFIATAVVAVGLGMLFSSVAGTADGPGGGPGAPELGIDSVSLSLAGFNIAQLIVGVLGVLVVTSEYATGMIRTTFAAVTRRATVLQAKTIVFGAVSVVVLSIVAVLSFFGGQAVYGGSMPVTSIGDPGVLRAVLGTAVLTAGIGLLGVALGFLLRSTAGAIGVLMALVLVVPTLVGLLPESISDVLTKILPSNAGAAFTSVTPDSSLFSPTVGFVVFAAWVVGLLAAATVVVRRRDA
jgi:ABC-type transport system involved in multi-copper enzyme maturation permease subunit